ncbi:hypothetical protein D9M71_237250 [compost metagenome]
MRHALALAAHRRAEFFLQGVDGGDLHAQQIGDRFVGVRVALVRELAHLREHAVGVVPGLQNFFGQLLLAFADGDQQRAVFALLLSVGHVGLAVEQNVFVSREPLYHDAGLGQGGGIDLRLGGDQLLDLTADQVFLVRPELHLPRTVAFGQRPDQQRLQLGPGFLRMQEVGTGGFQGFLAFAVGEGADCQLTVGFNPAGVGRQDHRLGDGRRRDRLRILGRAGAQGEGGKAGEQQFGTEHVGLPRVECVLKGIQERQQRSALLGIERQNLLLRRSRLAAMPEHGFEQVAGAAVVQELGVAADRLCQADAP